MRGRKYFGLLVMLLFAFVAMLAPTTANSEEAIGYGTDPLGNRWELKSIAGGVCSYTDNKGAPYPGIEFKYIARSLDRADAQVIQANVDFTICEPAFTKTAPSNSSVKIRDCDPNAPFRCDDPTKDVVTFESINYSNGVYEFKFCAENAGIKKATAQLKTQYGNVIVPASATQGAVLGPGCCSNIQRITEATFLLPNAETPPWSFTPDNSKGSFKLSFDACTGDIKPPPIDPDTTFNYVPIPGGFICLGSGTSYDKTTCSLVQKYGPEPLGSNLVTEKNIYVGYGFSSWKGPQVNAPYPDIGTNFVCESIEAHYAASLTYSGGVNISLDWCGSFTDLAGVTLWHCEADSRGRLIDSTCGKIITGSGVFAGTCRICKNGVCKNYPDSYCQ